MLPAVASIACLARASRSSVPAQFPAVTYVAYVFVLSHCSHVNVAVFTDVAATSVADALHTLTLDVCPVRVGHRVACARALLTGQAAQEYDPARVPCFAIVLSVRDRSLCLRASEAEAQAAGHLDAADVNGNGVPI